MMGISDTELGPRKGIRTRLYQFAWGVTLYHNGGEIACPPIIVNVPGGRTPEILAMNALHYAMKAATDDAWQVSQYSGSCTYTFTVLSDREFMMVEAIDNYDDVVFLYRLMGEMDLRPEVAQ